MGHHHHHHGHAHDHGHDHAHDEDHHHHGPGHNHAHGADHLHSHPHGPPGAAHREELRVLGASFIDGFRAAADKTSYLRLANIPFARQGRDGLTMHLVDAAIVSNWQIGTASPAFASRELVYMPFPGDMIDSRETMTFTYVSLTERADIDLLELIGDRVGEAAT